MAEVIPVKALKTGSTATALSEFEPGDTLPDVALPSTIARISGATNIAVVSELPGVPDEDTVYLIFPAT